MFDCDNTCLFGDIGDLLWDHLVRQRALAFDDPRLVGVLALIPDARPDELLRLARDPRQEQAYLEAWLSLYPRATLELGYEQGLLWVTRVMVGLLERDLKARCREAAALGLKRPYGPEDHPPGIRICQEVREVIRALQARGVLCVIVSASCRWPVQAIAPRLDVPAEQVLAIDMEVDAQGRLTSTILPPVTYRQGKLDAIVSRFKRPPQIVFGDALTDFEMLREATELGVLIDRGRADVLEAVAALERVLVQPRASLHFVSS